MFQSETTTFKTSRHRGSKHVLSWNHCVLYQLCVWYWTQILFFVKNTQNPRSFWLKSALNLLNILNFVFLTKIVRTRKVLEIFMKNTRKSWPSDKTVRVIRRKTLFSKKRFSLVAFKSSRKHYFFFKKIKIYIFSRKKVFYQKELHEKGWKTALRS